MISTINFPQFQWNALASGHRPEDLNEYTDDVRARFSFLCRARYSEKRGLREITIRGFLRNGRRGFSASGKKFYLFFCRINSNKIKFTSLKSVFICALSTLILHSILFHMPKSTDNLLRIWQDNYWNGRFRVLKSPN